MVKVKWDKLCGTDGNGKMGQSLWDGGGINLRADPSVFIFLGRMEYNLSSSYICMKRNWMDI